MEVPLICLPFIGSPYAVFNPLVFLLLFYPFCCYYFLRCANILPFFAVTILLVFAWFVYV